MSVTLPVCAVVFGSVAPPQGDIVDLRVHLGATDEVSSFECLLQNFDKKYSPGGTYPINVGDDGSISIGRGANCPLVATIAVEETRALSDSHGENYLRVLGRCWGERLFRKVVTKTYENQKGEAIVKDIIDYYVGLSHVRNSVELVENTDTTYTKLEYENTPVFDILKYIAKTADKTGVIGFDFRVAPDAKFEFFAKNSKTSSVSLSERLEGSEYRKDVFRKRNKIFVYGYQGKNFPSDLDSWSESLSGWVLLSGTNLSLDSSMKRKGNYSLYVATPSGGGEINIYRIFSALSKPQTFVVWIRIPGNLGGGYAYVRLWAPDSSNYFQADIKSFLESKCILSFALLSLALGSNQMYDPDHNPNGVWTKTGNPQWNQISGLQLIICTVGATSYVNYDGDFGLLNCSYTGTYGAGDRELAETDEELHSDNECLLRAKALYDNLSSLAEYIRATSDVIDYGSLPILAADRIWVTLPNENVDGYYPVISVEYRLIAETQTLESILELGKEPPLLADYLYALRSKTASVARYKIGRI